MARARNIKPKIMDNEDLADLPPLTRLLFIYLWMLADRDGRLEDRPKRIAVQALPYDRDADVDAMLSSLHDAGFISRYKSSSNAIIQIVNFAKHQTPHVRESASELPEQVQGIAKAVPNHSLGDCESSPRSPDSLIPDSLIPDSLIPDSGLLKSRDDAPAAATPDGKPDPSEKLFAKQPDRPRTYRMTSDWMPPETFEASARIAMVDPKLLTNAVLDKFRNNYADGAECTTGQWVNRLIDWIKRERPASEDSHRSAAKPAPSEKKIEYWTRDPKVMMTPSAIAALEAGRALLK